MNMGNGARGVGTEEEETGVSGNALAVISRFYVSNSNFSHPYFLNKGTSTPSEKKH